MLPTAPPRAPQVDHRKSAVVFHRYYHLFAAGELEALVHRLGEGGGSEGEGQGGGGGPGPRAVLLDSFFDRSNWCVVFGRLEG